MSAEGTSRIDRLLLEVSRLPDLHDRASVVGRLHAIRTRIDAATAAMIKENLARRRLIAVAGKEYAPDNSQTRKRVLDATRELLEFIKAGRVSAASKKDETLILVASDGAAKIHRDVSNAWTDYIHGRLVAFRRLAAAAIEANLAGAPKLQRAVAAADDTLEADPQDERAVQGAVNALSAVRQAVEELGLEGKPGDFLVAAVRGDATPQLFMTQEVQDFLKLHSGLFSLLRIRLA